MLKAVLTIAFLMGALPGGFFGFEIPVDKMTIRTAGTATEDGWNLHSNGYIGIWLNFREKGKYKIKVLAKGEKAGGEWPVMELLLNTEPVKKWSVESEDYAEHTAQVEIDKGTKQLLVAFRNDYFKNGEDRNLHVSSVKFVCLEGSHNPFPTHEPDWKKEADKRIDELRKGELTVELLDSEGKPASGVQVDVRLIRHEFRFGTCINARFFQENSDNPEAKKYREILKSNFNCAVFENAFKWPRMEPDDGKPYYHKIDAALKWLENNNMPVRGHCIFWANEKRVPDWAIKLDDEQLLSAIDRRITRDLMKYRGRIPEYDVNNEMIKNRYFKSRLGDDIRAHMFKLAHKTDPGARLFVNDYNILNGISLDEYVKQIKDLLDKGAPIGGIGCQGHFGPKLPPLITVKMHLDRLAKFKLPILITEFDINTKDEKAKAEQLEDFYRLAFSHPAVEGILMWGFWERAHWRPDAAIYDRDFSPRQAAQAYRGLVFDKWRTAEKGVTDENGKFSCPAFYGSYGITVTIGTISKGYRASILSREKKKTVTFQVK